MIVEENIKDEPYKHHLPIYLDKRPNFKSCYKNGKIVTYFTKSETCDIHLCIKSCFYKYYVSYSVAENGGDYNFESLTKNSIKVNFS